MLQKLTQHCKPTILQLYTFFLQKESWAKSLISTQELKTQVLLSF